MKKLVLLLVASLFFTTAWAQLSGTYYIPTGSPSYPTIADAFTALNTSGVSGHVIFEVAGDYTESGVNLILNTTTSDGSKTITFRKNGGTNNPKITATAGGTSVVDGVIIIAGTDYVTFDGIDVDASGQTTVEFGYAMVKKNSSAPFDGCQYNVIRNCTVTVNKSNTNSVGIHLGNHTATSSTSLTITATSDANSYNKLYSNTISNCWTGVDLRGYNASSPYTLYDQNNEVGVAGANTISDYGTSSTSYGLYAIYQNGMKVANNSFTSATTGCTGTLYGVFASTGTSSNVDIYGNTITIHGKGSSSSLYGINNAMGSTAASNTVNIYDNEILNVTYTTATTGAIYSIVNSATATNVNIYNNLVHDISYPGTGAFYGIQGGGPTNLNIYDNQVYNITKSGASGTIYGIHASTAILSVHDNIIHDISIPSTSGTSSAIIYGIYDLASPTSEAYYNNHVYNLTVAGSTTSTSCRVDGIYTFTVAGSNKNIYNNEIHGLSTHIGNVNGIRNNAGNNVYIYKNNIYDLYNAAGITSGVSVKGIELSTTVNTYVYNNFISDLRTGTCSYANVIAGIDYISTTATNNLYVYYNTIYLNASSSGTNFGSSAINVNTAPGVTLKNNILYNISTPNGTGFTVAYRRSSTTLTTYVSGDNNCFYTGGDPNQYAYFDGTTPYLFDDYKTLVNPRDFMSFSQDPPFINAPTDLGLQTGVPTKCESGGATITTPAITDDFEGDARYPNPGYPEDPGYPAAAPDVGADEFAGTPQPEDMAYQSSTTVAASTAAVYASSVNQQVIVIQILMTGTANPLHATAFDLNTNGSTDPLTDITNATLYYTGTSNVFSTTNPFGSYAGPDGAFQITGDQQLVQGTNYFWLAYDISATPTLFDYVDAECNAMTIGGDNYVPTVQAPGGARQVRAPLNGDYTVGVGEDYATITAAMADLALVGVSGAVNFLLTDASYSAATGETLPILVLTYSGQGPSNPVTIKPASGNTAILTGSTTTGIFVLYGCDYFTIDGSNSGGTDRNLTIENTNTAANTYAIGVFNDGGTNPAQHCTIKNAIVKGGGSVTNNIWGIILNASGGDFDNIIIDNNEILKSRVAIQFAGVAGAISNDGQIINNKIGSSTDADAITYRGITTSYCDNLLIGGNEIMGVVSGNTNTSQAGIYVGTLTTNLKVRKNKIHDIHYTGTGGYGSYGIYFAGDNTTTTEISNNLMYELKSDGDQTGPQYASSGIYFSSGGNAQIFYNTINMTGNSLGRGTTYNGISCCISTSTSVAITGLDIRNNILKNSMGSYPGSTRTNKTYAVYFGGTSMPATTIDYNNYYYNGVGPVLGRYNSSDRPNLASWQMAPGQDVHSHAFNPALVSETDLQITARNASGVALTGLVDDDYAGNPRDVSAPDLGAYESSNLVTNLTWTGSVDNSWINKANWSPSSTLPNPIIDVVLEQSSKGVDLSVIQNPEECDEMTIKPGSQLTVESNKSLYVNGDLLIESTASGTGSLVEFGTIYIKGTSTVQRYLSDYEWHLISPPISNADASVFLHKYLQTHSEATNTYTDIYPETTPLDVMKGYAFFWWGDFTATYTGALNSGSIGSTDNLTRSGSGYDDYGWNLVGNPYPSSLDWDAASGWTKTNLNNATYIHVNSTTWATYIAGVGTNGGSRYIAPGQGFFVTVTDGFSTGTMVMEDNVRAHNNTTFFKNDALSDVLRLKITNNTISDETVIRFLEPSSPGFDGNFDALKIVSYESAAQLYTPVDNLKLSINALPSIAANPVVPVGLYVGANGVYSIQASGFDNFDPSIPIRLEDIKEGVMIDLRTNPEYTFNASTTDDPNRFNIHFKWATGIEPANNQAISIFSDGNDICINPVGLQIQGEVAVYNSIGQEVIRKMVDTETMYRIPVTLPTGCYVVKVFSNNNVVTKKVFVR